MSVVLHPSSAFPPGTSVAAYPESNWLPHLRPPSGAPAGSAAETDTVAADGSLTYDSLVAGTRYFAYAQVGGVHRYVGFTAKSDVSQTRDSNAIHGVSIPAPTEENDGQVSVYDYATGEFVWTDLGLGNAPPPDIIPAVYCHQEDPTPILKYAKARGFTAITASEYIAAVRDGAPLPAKPYFLSFDDEPAQWVTVHDPALAAYGAKATGFITSGYADGEVMGGGSDAFFYTNTSPMTWAQLRTLRDTGRWDFQSHGRNHLPFNTLNTAQRTAEWDYSQARFLAELGVVPRAFAHPQNAYTMTSVDEAFARGFELVTLGQADVAGLTMHYGLQGRYGRPFRQGENRRPGPIIVARGGIAGVEQLDTVVERVGNRIPDVPIDDNTLGIWTVPPGEGTEGSSSNGVRFDNPNKSGTIDLRANGSTTNVSTILTHLIPVEEDERLTFAYLRECGVGAGSYIVRLKKYDRLRAFISNDDIETLTGTQGLDDKEVVYQVPAGVSFVKIDVRIVNGPSGSYATFQVPFLGRVR